MPRITLWSVRLAGLHLFLGITVGAALLIEKAWRVAPWLNTLIPFHRHALMFGWILQLAVGVAYWILPTHGRSREPTRPVVGALVLINSAVLLAALSPRLAVLGSVAIFMELIAAMLFATNAWPRVKKAAHKRS